MITTLNSLHHQHIDWLRELEFYKDEIALLAGRLEDIMEVKTSAETAARAQEFQHTFFTLREELDNLKRDMRVQEHKIGKNAGDRPGQNDDKYVEDNDSLHTRMKLFTSNIADTRLAFNNFLLKTVHEFFQL